MNSCTSFCLLAAVSGMEPPFLAIISSIWLRLFSNSDPNWFEGFADEPIGLRLILEVVLFLRRFDLFEI